MSDVKMPTLGEELLEGLVALVAESAARVLEANPELTKALADDVATRFSEQYGGAVTYIPKGRVFRTSALYREIYERFNGSNLRELSKDTGMSVIHIYRILARERNRDRAARQGTLIPPPLQP